MNETAVELGIEESTDVSEVRASISSEIDAARVEGIDAFNSEEKMDWIEGVEACETIEIALSLYDYLSDFVQDGKEVLYALHDKLNSAPIAQVDKREFLKRAQIASFEGKNDLLTEVEKAVQEASALQEQVLAEIADQTLSVSERAEVLKRFEAEGASRALANYAQQVVRTARERVKSRRAVLEVEGSLQKGEAESARDMLNARFGTIFMSEYVRLDGRVSDLEAAKIRQSSKAWAT